MREFYILFPSADHIWIALGNCCQPHLCHHVCYFRNDHLPKTKRFFVKFGSQRELSALRPGIQCEYIETMMTTSDTCVELEIYDPSICFPHFGANAIRKETEQNWMSFWRINLCHLPPSILALHPNANLIMLQQNSSTSIAPHWSITVVSFAHLRLSLLWPA